MHRLVLTRRQAQRVAPKGWEDSVAVYVGFVGLQFVDLMSTLAVLILGGEEANEFMVPVLASGPWALVAAKGALVVFTALTWVPMVWWLYRRPEPVRTWAIAIVQAMVLSLVMYYSAVVFLNLANLAILVAP